MSQKTPNTKPKNKPRFISMRWRFILPLFIALLPVAMIGAYVLANNLGGGMAVSQDNILLQNSRAVTDRTAELYAAQVQEAQRVAFTENVGLNVLDEQTAPLQDILESLARLAELDSIIVTDLVGREVLGVLRVETPGLEVDYAVSSATDLSDEPLVRAILSGSTENASGLMRAPLGLMLFSAVPLRSNDQQLGVVLVGNDLSSVLAELKGSALADVALYGDDGTLLQTTYPNLAALPSLELAPELFGQALGAVGQVVTQNVQIGEQRYRASYQPFVYGGATIGVVAALLPDDTAFATEVGRQITALFASALTGAAVIVAFVGVARMSGRIERVTTIARDLAAGNVVARTDMLAKDEIGAMGQALDQYAEYAQHQQDTLRSALRRQRRETAHLVSVLETMGDGVVVQDLDGRVLLMNELARTMLGSQRVFRSSGLHELSAVVASVLGAQLAPGLYALGDPQRVDLDGKMLSAQAAAILSATQQRVGTVIVLRDITDEVRRERANQRLFNRLEQEVQQPLADLARIGMMGDYEPVRVFAKQMIKHALTLQKMIVEMRELTGDEKQPAIGKQRAISMETLLWACANEWRQVAQASGLVLHIIIEQKGLFVLGDEKRLRWAIGNILDNAIKYTPAGGALTLEIKGEEHPGMAFMRVRDNGVGVSQDDLPHLFTRFYRGTPTAADGTVIRVPGMGQGLSTAKTIFEAHGGSIKVKSSQGIGTAVYFALPITYAEMMQLPTMQSDYEGETMAMPVKVERGRK
jgi:two-component system, OmpR family, sensor histidine kinase ResE